jgi:DNA-binding cell septation regulator SpoVG
MMNITIKEVRANRRKNPNIAAEVTVVLAFGGHTVTIDDMRVLLGKKGPWVAMPSFAIQNGTKDYVYEPAVVLSAGLAGEVEDAVLKAFEKWQQNQQAKAPAEVNVHGVAIADHEIPF